MVSLCCIMLDKIDSPKADLKSKIKNPKSQISLYLALHTVEPLNLEPLNLEP
jgi:hypothetical protein